MTSTSTLPRHNRFRLRAAGILTSIGLMVGLGAAQTANAWVNVGGVYVRMTPQASFYGPGGTYLDDNPAYCNSPQVLTEAEEYWQNYLNGPSGGVEALAEFHVVGSDGYWKWLSGKWTPMGFPGHFWALAPAPRYTSNEVRVNFRRKNRYGYFEYAQERAVPFIDSDAYRCKLIHENVI